MDNKLFLVLLVTFFSVARGQIKINSTFIRCSPTNINCVCGIKPDEIQKQVEVKRIALISVKGVKTCLIKTNPAEACRSMMCQLSQNQSETFVLANFYANFGISIPRGSLKGEHRISRSIKTCKIKGLDHADVKCWKYPGYIDCLINCTYGYALRGDEGLHSTVHSKGITCSYDENRWYPHTFQDCEPYLNCKAHLVAAGNLKCMVPLNEPPYCDIACVNNEDKDGTHPKKYVCKDENFGDTLPYCAALNKFEPLLDIPITEGYYDSMNINQHKTDETEDETEEEEEED